MHAIHACDGFMAGDRHWHTRGMDDSLDHVACDECGAPSVVALLSDGTALCACCAAIRWRIPSSDPVVVKAEIGRR
jgi:hypothetical protein